jgi:uncharacterized membrane protein YdjX (TVP38/TMEM64 family)
MEEVGRVRSAPWLLRRLLPLGGLAAAIALFFALGGGRYLTVAALAENRVLLAQFVARAGPAAVPAYVVVYAAIAALSLPGAAIMTLAGGLLFGTAAGGLAALTGATLGASALFLIARTSLGAIIERRAGPRVRMIETQFRAHAASYLLVLRLVPLFPFWAVNLASGFLGMRLQTFALFSFVGMAPGTFLYANLGAGLGDILAAGGTPDLMMIFAPRILLPLLGLAGLALVPALARRKARR